MRLRLLLTLTAIVSSLLGAVVVYLALSVPNDLRADALLKEAQKELAAGNHDRARGTLGTIMQRYPRTDAAAAATVALLTLDQREREEFARALGFLRRQTEQQAKAIEALQKSLSGLRAPPAQPPTATAPPPPTTKVAPKTTAKKTTPKKTTRKK